MKMRRLLAVLLLVGLGACTSDEAPAEKDALVSARLAAANLGQLVTGAHQLLRGLAQVPAITESDRASCKSLAAKIVERYDVYGNLSRVDTHGVVDCSATPSTDRVTVNDRLYYKRVLETKDFSVGEYQIGRITKKKVIIFAQPVLDGRQVASTLILSVELEMLNKRLAAFPIPEGATLTLLDGAGTVLATTAGGEDSIGRKPRDFGKITTLGSDVREGSVGTLDDLDGESRSFSFRVVDGLPKAQNLYMLVGV